MKFENRSAKVIEFHKACDCEKTTASAGQVRIKTEKDGNILATFTPGLSCDTCGTPWRVEEKP